MRSVVISAKEIEEEGCWQSTSPLPVDAATLARWLVEQGDYGAEVWAELQDLMRTATGGPLAPSDCVGGGR